jgi:plastocyanin
MKWLLAGVVLSGALSAGLHLPAAAGTAKTHRVVIEGTAFQPAKLTVAVGDSVVWINKDPFPHTATATSGAFDSKNIGPEKSWTFKAVKKGEFAYICSLHPTMKGELIVSPPTAGPAPDSR